MIELDKFIETYQILLANIKRFKSRIIIAGMLPVDDASFPGSAKQFHLLNGELCAMAEREGVEFLDWGSVVESQVNKSDLYYRDGFHFNANGARLLARLIFQHIFEEAERA
jgi:lysophospholipase L1-like esterase